ncbi:PRTRC system protein C [Pedobacter sp. UBA4863]|uniref:PRTRC system protein C n=1 Tax=Pedobacter sp. UBA4863 TaxID=1947060 RepID=UPI0025CE5470|nr:PRTRC system protein C [Pedobacter sp. UBA4863]
MLLATQMERCFSFTESNTEIELADPSATYTPEGVLNFYSQSYPILTTARIVGPEIRDDKVCYRFETTMGTKG